MFTLRILAAPARVAPSLVLLLSCLASAAQDAPDAAARAEARARFDRGVVLFDEGRLDAALAEFEEARRVAPSFAIYFNLGRVHARLGHAVEAVVAFERYLADGGDRVPAERRAIAERELREQRARIATLAVEVDVEGASIAVDGSVVATSPLSAPLRVAVGEHTIAVRAGGYEPQQRRISLAGGVTETMRFTLTETGSARGTIRVTSPLRDVELTIDGEGVGRTPFDASLSIPAGTHAVRATRPGYQPFSGVVDVGMGAEAELDLRLEPDLAAREAIGALAVRAPASATVSIDGAIVESRDAIELPQGDHEVRVEMPDVQPFVQRVVVAPGETTELTPALRYTAAARAARQGGAQTQRVAGVVLAIAGGALLAGGAGVIIWNEARRQELALDDRRALLMRCYATPTPAEECFGTLIPVGTSEARYPEALDDAQDEFNADAQSFNGLLGLGYALIGVGAASILTSVVLFVTAPSEEDTATVRVGLGPGRVELAGTF